MTLRESNLIKQVKTSDNVYVIATQTHSTIGKLIRWASSIRAVRKSRFDHVIMVRNGWELHMTTPHVEIRSWELRSYNEVYQIIKEPYGSWGRAADMYSRHALNEKSAKYGKAQLVTKLFTQLFGIDPIKAGRDCIEFVLESIIEPKPSWVDRVTVDAGIDKLIELGYLKKVGFIGSLQ